ncbi:hypothetical protein HZH68_005901 [Vespula germanica]|uniref:Uncharacterized protein n=1 Tax=Vespula germanica TaxID=30212 RepID=A0A834NEQ2_VESGE|nr:hypothetical protein HZH68_005901 [Vespula germanica]
MKLVRVISRRRGSSSTVAGETSKNALLERSAGYSCEEEGAEPQATLCVARFDGTRADASNYSPIFAAAAPSSAFKHQRISGQWVVADRARCLNIWNDPDGWVTPRKTCGESVTKRSTAGGLQMPGDYGVYPPAGY